MDNKEGFEQKTLTEKINLIDEVLEKEIRSFLQRDNGDLELINVVEKNEYVMVYIEYQGACVGCSSSGGTLKFMENILHNHLSTSIRVVSV